MRAEIDHYTVLNVSPGADEAIIRAAYRVLAKRYHPDLATGARARSTEKFQQITEAYRILGNADRRAQYDEQRNRRENDTHGTRREGGGFAAQRSHSTNRQAYEAERPRAKNERGRGFTKRPNYAAKYSIGGPSKVRIAFKWFAGLAALAVIANVLVVIGNDPDPPAQSQQADRADAPPPIGAAAARQVTLAEAPSQPETQYAAAQSLEADQKWRAAESEREERERQERERQQREQQEQARQEQERQEQARIAQAKEVERSRVQAERASAGYPSTGTKPNISNASALEAAVRKSTCTSDEGTKFSITNLYGDIDVAYKGAPPVRARIDPQGPTMIMLSKIVASNAITIVLMKGERNGTMLIVSDASGNKPTRSVAAKCVGLVY